MIVVCPFHAVPRTAEQHRVSHVVSLLGPETFAATPGSVEARNHLRLSFHDIAAPLDAHVLPSQEHVDELIEFFATWDRRLPMLIHCWAGISRSTAAAYIGLCYFRRDEDEHALAQALRGASPTATPNSLIVAHADRRLGRQGRMIEAIAAIGRGAAAFEGNVFALPVSKAAGADRRRGAPGG